MPEARNLEPVEFAFGLGMNTRQRITDLPTGAARLIENADVTVEGNVKYPRRGYTPVSGANGGHSLWTHPKFNAALYLSNGSLLAINKGNQQIIAVKTGLDANQEVAYTFFAERVYWSNGSDMGYVSRQGINRLWGVDAPPDPILSPSGGSALAAGRYLVALTVTYNTSEESAPSNISLITLASAGTITVSPLPASGDISHVNIYCSKTSAPDGEELFYAGRVESGMPSFVIDDIDLKRPLKTLNLTRFPVCSFLCSFKRHILGIYNTNELVWSEARQASLWNKKHGRIKFDGPLTFIAPVDDGVYAGTAAETYYLQGTHPRRWQKLRISQHGIIPQKTVCWLPDDTFPSRNPLPAGPAVPWVTTEGDVAIGRSSGIVQRVASGLAIQNHSRSRLQFFEADGIRRLLLSLNQPLGVNARLSPDVTISTVNQYGITL